MKNEDTEKKPRMKGLIKYLTHRALMEALRKPEAEPEKFSEATEGEKQYLAGLWDADGSFSIVFKKRSKSYRPRATLSGTSLLLYQLSQKYEGAVYLSSMKKGKKPSYNFVIRAHEPLREFLNAVIPYLWIKQCQAQLLLEALNIIEVEGYSDETRAKLEKLKQGVEHLNKATPKIPEVFGDRVEYLRKKSLLKT